MRIVASKVTRFPLAASPAREGLLLELTDDEGRVGQGEATPYPGFSREDVASCERALERARVGFGSIEGGLPAASAVSAALAALDPGPMPAAARFAIETATLDLLGRRQSASISEILRGDRPPHPVLVNGLLVASPDAEALVGGARAIARRGLRSIKIKLRSPDAAAFARDLAALAVLRSELPPPFEIRFDANGAWTLDEARRRLEALAPLAPAFVEQPVAPQDLPLLGRCAVPWAADESLLDEDLVPRLLDAEGCSAFILKPSVLGVIRALDLAARAGDRGLGVVVTHFFDGPVAFAAACEVALALPHPPLACGLDPHAALAAWPDAAPPQVARSGLVAPSGRPGLGVHLNLRAGSISV